MLVGAAPGNRPGGDSFAFGGRVIAADSGVLDGVHVVAADAMGTYEAIVDSSGVFVGSFPGPPVGRVTLRVFSDSSARRYHTSVVTLGAGVPTAPTRVVLVPTIWRIRGGAFDGIDVPIDPVRATTRYADGIGYWRLTRRGHLAGRAITWDTDSLPVRVAFRHERNDAVIFEADSIAFWRVADDVERVVGRRLFRPAAYEEVEAGGDGIFVTIDRRMTPAGRTFITYDQGGRIYEALVTVSRRESLGDSRIASHELLHAIGLGHTGAWPSVMGVNTGAINAPSLQDVAYAQAYYALARLQRERGAPFGILESGRD
ncbi:MAG TPA: carboxypeptidase-like regulatory domain-containing protein [Gemmatimonadaceae bacterium]|nr:carboxypeptidase-like regulatory domain-containing protein [Gemmatimonadaceae bacterium]